MNPQRAEHANGSWKLPDTPSARGVGQPIPVVTCGKCGISGTPCGECERALHEAVRNG